MQYEFDYFDGIFYVDCFFDGDWKIVQKIVCKCGWGCFGVSWMFGVDDFEG